MLLGGWLLVLRFHQAVARDWPEVGPVLGVPVVVGQHGTGPWQVSVFTPGDDVPAVLRTLGRFFRGRWLQRPGPRQRQGEALPTRRSPVCCVPSRLADSGSRGSPTLLRQHPGPIATAVPLGAGRRGVDPVAGTRSTPT